ncbi:hypothetical protein [Stenotrophomonas sp. 3(2025)]|uniref:hypothetical protein n=1 Tax=Stenotrophomonas sp. 3(2025) TaxID=3456023 RepID=UPI0040440E21
MPTPPHSPPPVLPLVSSLVRHYEDRVDYLRRRLASPGLAREAVHDVCVRLLERPEPAGVLQPIALLRRMAHDAAVDRCRAEDLRGVPVASFKGYTTVDLVARYALGKRSFTLGVQNLANKQSITYYSQTTPSNPSYFAGRGRVLTLGWQYRY